MREKILDFLKKKQGYVSGDHLSHRLGISRQALWKHVQELRDSGYDIAAVPHLGYQLIGVPDRLFPSEIIWNLNTKFVGKKIYYFDTLSSTMDIATELGMKGLPEGTLVLAETQTQGRGRQGRSWSSPKYKGLYLSLILRPAILPNSTPVLTLLAAVSICEAVKEFIGLDTQIKWPNDLLIKNKKLGGILTELNAEMDVTRFVIIGAGLNINNEKKALPEGATSLKEQKQESINRVNLLQEILRKIETNYLELKQQGSKPIIDKWREHSFSLGKRVKISSHGKLCEGQAFDIDPDGGLLIRKDSGLVEKIMAGDILHCR